MQYFTIYLTLSLYLVVSFSMKITTREMNHCKKGRCICSNRQTDCIECIDGINKCTQDFLRITYFLAGGAIDHAMPKKFQLKNQIYFFLEKCTSSFENIR